jgi:uncharacterized protein YfaS (alpha-2-macroglobulin family)
LPANVQAKVALVHGPPALVHGPLALLHGPPARVHGPPALVHGLPALVHGQPALVHGPPALVHGQPALVHGLPSLVHGPLAVVHAKVALVHGPLAVVHAKVALVQGPQALVHGLPAPSLAFARRPQARGPARIALVPASRICDPRTRMDPKRSRGGKLLVIGTFSLVACLHTQLGPQASLAPEGADAPSARARGPFHVVYAAPRGKLHDRRQPGVTILFSRAMRSVDTPDDAGIPTITVHTQAGEVAGSWRWTGTRGLLFTPKDDLPGGSDFEVTVPAGVKSADGSVLEHAYTLQFKTDGPRVLGVTPVAPIVTSAQSLPPDATFRVDVDQPVEAAALQAATTLRVFAGDGDRGEVFHVQVAKTAPSPLATPAHGSTFVLTPDKPLPLDRDVELTIASALRGVGPRTMENADVRTMRTHGPLRLVDFYCPRIVPNGKCRAGGDVKLTFSTPVDPAELKAHIKGLPPERVPLKNEKRFVGPQVSPWLWVMPKLGASYNMTVTAGMRDVYGQKLATDAPFTIDVESPLVKPPASEAPTPVASAQPAHPPPLRPARVGDTRPRRERLPYRLDLGLVGEILEANGPHKIPVGAINIPEYAKLAAPLSPEQAAAWTLGREGDFMTRNALTPTWSVTHAATNEREVSFLDLDQTLASHHGRGPAFLALFAPGGQSRTESIVTVTDLGVSAKLGPYGGLVWVTHLSTGKPVAKASVAVQVKKDGVVFEGTTDADGVVTIPRDKFDPTITAKGVLGSSNIRDDAAIVVRDGEDWTITKVKRSQADARLTADFSSMSKLGQWEGMLFADRGVFRPGETAKVSGIARVATPGGLRSVPGRELRIELKDHYGEQLFDGRATCDDYGTFSVDVAVPKNAEIGFATLTATAAAGGKSNTAEAGVFTHTIRILAYTADEFKVSSEADKPFYIRGDTAVFSARGEYLYGAPMPGAGVSTSVTRQEVPFEVPKTDGYTTTDDVSTGDIPETNKAAQAFDNKDGTLDDKGAFSRRVELTMPDQDQAERVTFDVEVQDLSRRTVASHTGVVVHPGEFYVALRDPADRFAAVGAPYHAEVLAVEPTGARRGGVKVAIDLVERKWNSVTGEQPDGTPTHTTKVVDTVLSSCSVVTKGDAPAGCDVRVPRAGYFVVRATASDPRGNSVRSSIGVYGTESAPLAGSAWAADDHTQVKLEANKRTYEPGETAKVVLRNPFREAEALVTVERNGILWQKVMPVTGPLPVLSIPITPDLYPNAFLSVALVRGRIQAAPTSGADLGAPSFRLGYLELKVNAEAHRLHVNVTEPRAEYQPRDMVDADVTVTDASGKPAKAALTFYVVDEGVLALTSYKTPDPLQAFLAARKLAVFAVDNRELLARVIAMKAGERLASLGYEYALASNGSFDKGHDGGDGDGMKRADFRTTAFFEAGRKTDDNGKAHFRFKLPDNLTTFRVMAVAAGEEDRFGSGDSKVTTFRHLMALPALPKIVRVGDSLEASVVVASKIPGEKNPTGTMNVEVSLDAKGIDVKAPAVRTATLPRGGQTEVRFPVVATTAGEAVFSFAVKSGSDVDKVELKRTVTLPTTEESRAVYGETDSSASISMGDTKLMRPDHGGLTVHVASTPLVGLGGTLDYLIDYPYGCTEQLSSRLLPLLAADDLSHDLTGASRANAAALVDTAVEGILKRQNDDGGFGYWDAGSSEVWLSAYTMLALGSASEKRVFVPADALASGRSYLTYRLTSLARDFGHVEGDDDAADAGADAGDDDEKKKFSDREGEFFTATLIGDVLSTLGWAKPAPLNVLYEARAKGRLSAEASLLHAMARSGVAKDQLVTLTREIESRLRVGPDLALVDEPEEEGEGSVLESNGRTLAMVLRAFVAADPHHPLLPRIARGLLSLRKDGGWRTPQEDSWALMALADYKKVLSTEDGELSASVSLRGSSILDSSFPKGSTQEDTVFVAAARVANDTGGFLELDASGKGKLYYAAELRYETAALPTKPRDEGLFVQKFVRSVTPAALAEAMSTIPPKTADSVTAGDLVVVDLLFESAEPRDQVVLADPLPAGLSALDFDIDTTSQARRDATNATIDPKKAKYLGTTYRTAASRRQVMDDRVLTFFQHLEPGMYRVSYLARATSLGTFVAPPTRIEAMYDPDVFGQTAAGMLAVRAKP